MKQKIAVTLEENLVAFLDAQAKGNRSEYLNHLLAREHQRILTTELIAALQMDAKDTDYQAEIIAWDSVVGDGIDAEG
ncbi:MAG: CopG family transcriptional regulator [Hydrococcus sp. RM1_1_31]|nr:CopG family transcriptional regulator [Hydrococcus sp. RM1_1_31]